LDGITRTKRLHTSNRKPWAVAQTKDYCHQSSQPLPMCLEYLLPFTSRLRTRSLVALEIQNRYLPVRSSKKSIYLIRIRALVHLPVPLPNVTADMLIVLGIDMSYVASHIVLIYRIGVWLTDPLPVHSFCYRGSLFIIYCIPSFPIIITIYILWLLKFIFIFSAKYAFINFTRSCSANFLPLRIDQ